MENDNIVFNLKRKMFYIWIIMYFALIYIYIIFKSIFQLNSVMTCYVCVQLIKYIILYIYLFIYVCVE